MSHDIQALTNRVQELSRSVDVWNALMLWGLGFAAFAAAWIGIATRLVILRTGQQAEAQELLNAAKERELQIDLKQKDLSIAALNEESEGLKQKNLTLESNLLSLRKETQARRLTGEQKATLAKKLWGPKGNIAVVSPLMDAEASDFANDLEGALKEAGWSTIRIQNRITSRFGLSIVVTEGTPHFVEINLLQRALSVIDVPHDFEIFKDGDTSTSPQFQKGILYLVVEHKPLPTKAAHNTAK